MGSARFSFWSGRHIRAQISNESDYDMCRSYDPV
jgi:hypothetical protein